jgi:threonine/homoserine/homoserine lactone efflux protein
LIHLHNLPVFLLASFILLITPGPAVLYIVARSVDQGRAAGLVSVLAIETGNFLLVLGAALGLSAILLSSPLAFSVIKYLGAAYLIFLGVRRLLAREGDDQAVTVEPQSLGRIYSQGVIVAVLNPKTALFFFAYLPQFVDPAGAASASLQLLALGCMFVLMAICTDGTYALLASTAGDWLKTSRGFRFAERYVVAFVYIGLGVLAALGHVSRA